MEKLDTLGAIAGAVPIARSLNDVAAVDLDGAAELGLRPGEIVPLVSEGGQGQLLFQVDGRWFELNVPAQSKMLFAGKRFMRIAPQSAESALSFRPVATPPFHESGVSSRGDAFAAPAQAVEGHVAGGMPALRRLLSPDGVLELTHWASRLSMLEPFIGMLADPSKLTPAAIRRAFEASGLVFEKKLAKRGATDTVDLRSLLSRMLDETTDARIKDDLGQALTELDAVRAQMVAADATGYRFLTVAMPLKDEPPVILNLFRPETSEKSSPAPIVVDMYLNSAPLGNLWCRTVCEADNRLSVTICVRNNAIVAIARQFAASLKKDLSGFGLTLTKFNAYVAEMPAETGSGSAVDLHA